MTEEVGRSMAEEVGRKKVKERPFAQNYNSRPLY